MPLQRLNCSNKRWQGGEYFRINEAFLHILPGKVSSAGQVHPSPSHPQICTSSFPHPASNFSHNHSQSFLRIQFFSKNIQFYVLLRPFGLGLQNEIILLDTFRYMYRYSQQLKCMLCGRWSVVGSNGGRKWVSLGPFICVT